MRPEPSANLPHPGAEPFEPAPLHFNSLAQFNDSSKQRLAPLERRSRAELDPPIDRLFSRQLADLPDLLSEPSEFGRDLRKPFFVERVRHGKR
jgi:hypothetical protein